MDLIEKAKNYVTDKVTNMPKPEAEITDVDLKGLGMDGLTLLAKVCVSNPYSVSIPIGEIEYRVKSVDNVIVSGSIPDPGSLKSNDKTDLDVTVKVPHSALLSLAKDIGGDWDIDYVLELGLIVDLPMIGNVTIPVSYKGEMKLPTFKEMFFGKKDDGESVEGGEKSGADVKIKN